MRMNIFLFILMCIFATKYMIRNTEVKELKDLRKFDNKIILDLQYKLKKHNLDYSIG